MPLPFNNIMVTGGSGFIGTHFIHYMLNKYDTINMVNYDALTYAANLNNLKSIESDSRYSFIKGNVCDYPLLIDILKKNQIDTVVHFAAESHVDRSIENASIFIETNILGTHTLLEACRDISRTQSFFRFHHVSTDEVYGSLGLDDAPFSEDYPYRPNSPYAASKASSDHLVRACYKTYGLPVTISNCSNNYGQFQHNEKLIPKVINACLNQEKIPIYGDGTNIRDWLYVEDHCNGIDIILNRSPAGSQYNIGGDFELDNLSLVHYICEKVDALHPRNKPSSDLIEFVDDRLGHDKRYAVNFEKIRQELDWHPRSKFDSKITTLIKAAQETNV
jgi:dTDP-glucose 4,6-dehydratase